MWGWGSTNILQIMKPGGSPIPSLCSLKHPEALFKSTLLERKGSLPATFSNGHFLIWGEKGNLPGITNKMIRSPFPQRSIPNCPSRTPKLQLPFYIPWAPSSPGVNQPNSFALSEAPQFSVADARRCCSRPRLGSPACLPSWKKTALQMHLFPFWDC